jgi:hypothetical protein
MCTASCTTPRPKNASKNAPPAAASFNEPRAGHRAPSR